jgi:uncharacterized membrane protein required for colicin V production
MPHAPFTFGILVDALAVMVLLFFLTRGLIRGVSDELARLMGFVGGAWASLALYPLIQSAFSSLTDTTSSAAVAITSLALTLLAGFVIGLAVRCVFTAMFQVVILQPADAALGLAAGAVYASVILAVVFALAMIIPSKPVHRLFAEQSRVGQQICPWLRAHMGLQ